MGPCGTEGTFTSAAEETMRALRENSSELLTILSAIVSDPLYKWSVNETQARKRQMENDDDEAGFDEEEQPINRQSPQATSIYYQPEEDHNKAAMMAMAKIDEKLKGFEDGTSGEQQSVESQVQLLITTARDPDNLAVMFGGWSPWV
jgi:serine-protein kinase ATM